MKGNNAKMVSPSDIALEAARTASGDSSGKDILKRYRELVAQKSTGKGLVAAESVTTDDFSSNGLINGKNAHVEAHNLASELDAESRANVRSKEKISPTAAIRTRMKSRHMKHSVHDKPPQSLPSPIASTRRSSLPDTKILDAMDQSGDETASVATNKVDVLDPRSESCSSGETKTGIRRNGSQAVQEQDENGTSFWAMMGDTASDGDSANTRDAGILDDRKNIHHGGVLEEPGELISFLGRSFLSVATEENDSLRLERTVDRGDALSPLREFVSNENNTNECREKEQQPNDSVATYAPASDIHSVTTPSQKSFDQWSGEESEIDLSFLSQGQQHSSMVYSQSSRVISDDEEVSIHGENQSSASSLALSRVYSTPSAQTMSPAKNDDGQTSSASSSPLGASTTNKKYQVQRSKKHLSKSEQLSTGLAASEYDAPEKEAEDPPIQKKYCLSEHRTSAVEPCADDCNNSTVVSPFSGMEPKQGEHGKYESTAASLLEHNKTLVKEVRFADQTCVELSERNATLQDEVARLRDALETTKKENESLHDSVVHAAKHGAKMEATRDTITVQLSEQRDRFESHVFCIQTSLDESQRQAAGLARQLEERNKQYSSLQAELAASESKVETLSSDYAEAKETIAGLTERLVASNASAELSHSSASAAYRDSCNAFRQQLDDLQIICDKRLGALNREKEEKYQIEAERDTLRQKCSDLEMQVSVTHRGSLSSVDRMAEDQLKSPVTPDKYNDSKLASRRTPTSQVLAKTLQSELERGHVVADRFADVEKKLKETYSQLQCATRDLSASREEASCLRNELDRTNFELQKFLEERNVDGNLTTYPSTESVSCPSKADLRTSIKSNSEVLDDFCQPTEEDGNAQEFQYALEVNEILSKKVSSYEVIVSELQTELGRCRQKCNFQGKPQAAKAQLLPLKENGVECEHRTLRKVAKSAIYDMLRIHATRHEEVDSKLCEYANRLSKLVDVVKYLQLCFEFQSQSDVDSTHTDPLSCWEQSEMSVQSFDLLGDEGQSDVSPDMKGDHGDGTFTQHASSGTFDRMDGNLADHVSPAGDQKMNAANRSANGAGRESSLRISQLRAEIILSEEKRFRIEKEKTELLIVLESTNMKLKEQKGELTRLQEAHSREQSDLLSVINKQKCHIEKSQLEIAKLSDAASRSNEQLLQEQHGLQQQLSSMKSEFEICQEQLLSAQAEMDGIRQDAENTLKELECRERAVDQENQNLTKELRSLEDKLAKESERLKDSTEVAERYRQEMQRSSERVSSTTSALEEVRCEAADLRRALSVAQREAKESKSELDMAKNLLAEMEPDQSGAEQKHGGKLSLPHERGKNLASLAERLQEVNHNKGEKLQLLDLERKQLQLQLSSMKKDLEMKEKENDLIKNRCEELSSRMEKFHASHIKDATVIDELKVSLRQTRAEFDGLKGMYVACNEKLASALKQNTSNEAVISELRAINGAAEKELEQTQSDARKRIVDLENGLRLMKSNANQEIESISDELKAHKDNAQSILNEKERAIKQLETYCEERQSMIEQEIASIAQAKDASANMIERAGTLLTLEIKAAKEQAHEAATRAGVTAEEIQKRSQEYAKTLRDKQKDMLEPGRHASNQRHHLHNAIEEVLACRATIAVLDAELLNQNKRLQLSMIDSKKLNIELSSCRGLIEELKVGVENERRRANSFDEQLTEAREAKLSLSAAHRKAEEAKTEIENELSLTLKDLENIKRKHIEVEGRMSKSLQETARAKDNAFSRLEESLKNTEALSCKHEEMSKKLEMTSSALHTKTEESSELALKNQSLERKCVRLRDYIKKLTIKCEQWADSYGIQTKDLQDAKHEKREALSRLCELENTVNELQFEKEGRNRQIHHGRQPCGECKYLRRALATEGKRISALKVELKRRDEEVHGVKRKLTPTDNPHENKVARGKLSSKAHEGTNVATQEREEVVWHEPRPQRPGTSD